MYALVKRVLLEKGSVKIKQKPELPPETAQCIVVEQE
jgi:hypothetical protein